VELAASLAGGTLVGAAVGVLGLAFKPGTDDIRDSPALAVAAAVAEGGAIVTGYDPAAVGRARLAFPGLRYAASAAEAARGADVLLVLTDWPEFADLDPVHLGRLVARRAVADGRHVLDPARWRAAGWRYQALGGPRHEPPEGARRQEPVSQRSMQVSSSPVSTGLVT
jgi:UDPglucose 6-dehydrogenase